MTFGGVAEPFNEAQLADLRGAQDGNPFRVVSRLLATIAARDAEIARLRADAEHYRSREKHFAKVLNIPDGGQFRADWDGHLRHVVGRVAQLEAALDKVSDVTLINGRALWTAFPEIVTLLAKETP